MPKKSRRAFFARMTEHYRRYLPAGGYPVPGGIDGIRHKLVGRGSFGTFEVLRAGAHTVKIGRYPVPPVQAVGETRRQEGP